MTVYANSIIQNEIQIKNEIIIHVNIIVGTLAHVFVRIANI